MNILIWLRHKISDWVKTRWAVLPIRDTKHTKYFLIAFLLSTSFVAVLAARGAPLGPSILAIAFTIICYLLINALCFLIWMITLGTLLSFMYIGLPRLFLAGYAYTITVTTTVLLIAESGFIFSILMGLFNATLALILGLVFVFIFHTNIHRSLKWGSILIVLLLLFVGNLWQKDAHESADLPKQINQIAMENPATLGKYESMFFTYGTGNDKHREAFASEVNYQTETVDASDFVTRWSKKRKKFWGFDQTALPINGRVFMPDGPGPFPVMLIAHGNHTMEYLSTSGYDYLGQLLASRGIIMISVDEDYINYSGIRGSPNRNYELRTWIILQHIVQLQEMNDTPGNFLSGKVDFSRVAFAGHSRGGQAAHMAADYETFFPDDPSLETLADIDIKGVIAISPTDKTVDSKRSNVHNTSYLLMHGARDADVSSFKDAAFYRTTFDPTYDGFKSSIYISDANHTHFNSDWGSRDLSLPRGFFLNQQDTFSKEEQQDLAKVYIAAFLERIFHEEVAYEALFKNYQHGYDWLPPATYVNKYEHASHNSLQTYKANDLADLMVDGFSKQEIYRPTNRDDVKRKSNALALAWDNEAVYTLDANTNKFQFADTLSLRMANIDENRIPDIQVEFEMTDGITHTVPLADHTAFPAVIQTKFTWFGWFEKTYRDGKYKNAWEPVFQTFHIPLPSIDRTAIKSIQLRFLAPGGNILIEEIGLE